MGNVLSDEKKQQVIALGRLGWSLRRIEEATGVRRETAGVYLKAAGIGVRPSGGWGRGVPSKPVPQGGMTPDSDPSQLTSPAATDSSPDARQELDSQRSTAPSRSPSASACEPY